MENFDVNGAICTIRELIDRAAFSRGDGIFLISPESRETLSFAEFRKQAKTISSFLYQAGLAQGDKVAFLLDNGLFTIQLFLGTMYAGLVSVPLNVRAGVTQLTSALDHCEAKILFVEEQYAGLANDALAGIGHPLKVVSVNVNGLGSDLLISETNVVIVETRTTVPAADDVALLMYTSGSVGAPRAAIHSHRTLLAHGRNSMRSHQLTHVDRSLLVLPIYHINAECVTLMPTLLSGGSVVAPRHFNVSQFWDWLDEHRCTWSAIVPTIVSQLLDWKDPKAGQRAAAFRRIRFIRSSSAPLSPSLQREFMKKFPIRLIQAMGSSEAGNIFSNPQAPGENKIGTPGPAWGFETRIINPEGVDVKTGEAGEVLLRGPAIARGYYRDPEQTAAVFDEAGWLHTGDLAYQDSDGYFYMVGRSKELIIKGGMNIAPRQIDEVLESHPAVLEAAVVGVPDHYLGEDLAAFVVLRAGMQGDEREMLTFCESRLGHFKTPARIHFIKDLPKGPSGKVQRLRLLDQGEGSPPAGFLYANGHRSGDGQVSTNVLAAPAAIAEMIAQCWAAVLNIGEVGHDVNFFLYGGHSLTAIQCLSRLREKLPVVLSLSDFFENPTVAQQAALVGQRLAANYNGQARETLSPAAHSTIPGLPIKMTELPLVPVRGRSWPHPLSVDQRRISLFEELAPGVPLYNEAEAVRLRGPLHIDAMEQALNHVVARHETLRTTFQKVDGDIIAVVQATWTLRIKNIDLSSLATQAQESELERLLVDEPSAPYDLATTPGIRATVVRLGADEHIFILMMQHLVCDWASIGQLWREFSTAYRAIVRGEQLVAAPLAIQFGDYVVWQRQRIAEASFEEDLKFWEDNLRGAPDLLELPTDRPRPQLPSYRGAKKRFWLGAKLTSALREFSRQQKTSPFTIFTAAFTTLLYRYSGNEDISLGIPIGNRERPELQQLIGFLLHTHVLRTRLHAEMRFRDLLPLVQSGMLALYSHREAPFDEVVSRINPQRSVSRSPLFQVMLNWRDGDQQPSRVGLEGLAVESVLAETRTSKFDLTLMLTDDTDQVWLEAEYSAALFDDDRIDRMFGHYQTLLENVVADPDLPLMHIPLLTGAERHQLLIEWNATEVAAPQEPFIHQLFEQQAARTPHAVAAVCGDQSISYRELDQRSNQLARRLRRLGARSNSLIAVCLDRSIEMLIGVLGVLKAGGAYLPLDPAYPHERLAFMLMDSAASLIVTQSNFCEALPENHKTLCLDSDWEEISSEEGLTLEPEGDALNLAYVIYTSGSTGRPKGVEITHRSVVNLLTSMRKRPGLEPSDSLLAITTLSFDIAALELFLPLTVGARLIIASRKTAMDGVALRELLQSSHASVIQATPITFRMLIAAGWRSADWHLKVLCGGEALPRALADEILERVDELWNCYGPTETTIYSSVIKILRTGPITIGRPIDNTCFYILDANGELCPSGRPGELYIAGAGLAHGYLRRPELTAEKFLPNPFSGEAGARMYKTGDLVKYLPDGSVEYLGRIDQQVKIHGFRIELGEIEAALKQQSSVCQCVVIAAEDHTGDKQLVAYLVPAGSHPVPGSGQLRDFLKQSLPEYMIPKVFVILKQLPLTLNGKIDRKALPAPALGVERPPSGQAAPRNPVEESLAQICKEVLGVKEIGIRDNFFALGGDSLRATKVIAGVRRLLNQSVSVQTFFQNPTIEEMAQAISAQKPGSSPEQPHSLHVVLRQGAKSLAVLSDDARWVVLQRGKSHLSFFIVDSFPYFIDVVKLLGEQQPVISIVSHERARATADYDVVKEAAAHVQTILECQPQGPYLLGGCSASGVIAYEIAQQLVARGHAVGLVALFDTVNPYFMREYSALRRSLAHNVAELKRLYWYEIPRWAATKIIGLAAKKAGVVRASLKRDNQIPASDESQFGLSPSRIDAVRKYRPKPYSGRLLLFRRQRELGGRYRDPQFGWGEVAKGKIEVCELNGSSHLEIFKANSDRALVAQKLKSSFNEAEKDFEAQVRKAILNRRAHERRVPSQEKLEGLGFGTSE